VVEDVLYWTVRYECFRPSDLISVRCVRFIAWFIVSTMRCVCIRRLGEDVVGKWKYEEMLVGSKRGEGRGY